MYESSRTFSLKYQLAQIQKQLAASLAEDREYDEYLRRPIPIAFRDSEDDTRAR